MSSQPSIKHYMSRGIQTDSYLPLQSSSLCETQYSSNSAFVGDPAISHLGSSSEFACRQLLPAVLACESAYTQSRTGEISTLLPSISSRQNQKHSAIVFSRPADAIATSRRVVSLPDNPPLQQAEPLIQRKMRIVSMPESGKHATFGPQKLTNSSFASDVSRDSAGSPAPKQQFGYERTCPSDLPRTPTPPSSPESVMIVGNDSTHVSSSFLRRFCTDDDGWITWASSPPRPIPALHGPLSLPYARCPSGAEGTVIEGDDLSHKIWGLGIDDAQGNSRSSRPPTSRPLHPCTLSSNPTTMQAKKLHFENPQVLKTLALQRQRDAVIDLSKPSTFYSSVDAPSALHNNAPTAYEPQLYNTSALTARCMQSFPQSSNGLEINSTSLLRENIWQLDRTPPVELNIRQYASNSSGAGLTKNGPEILGDGQNRLNKSAPIFVPRSMGIGWRSRGAYIQQTEDHWIQDSQPRKPPYVQPTHTRQEPPNLLSPPSTSSPHWSPVFPNPIDVAPSRKMSSRHTQAFQCRNPKIYSPHPEVDDYSDKLMEMIRQISNQDLDNTPKRYLVDTSIESLEPMPRNDSITSIRRYEKETMDQNDACTLPNSSDSRPKFSYHPRSIPLARLIQRRLSSVTEEDVDGIGRSSFLPLLRKSDPHSDFKRLSSGPLDPQTPVNRGEPESIPTTEETLDKTEADRKTAQVTTSIEVQADDTELNAVVKLPNTRARRPSNGHAHRGISRRDNTNKRERGSRE